LDPVGRYQILEELGRGAHGVVYKALDPAIGRTIAIKAIALGDMHRGDLHGADREREGILREARLAGTLSHPNIVTIYDVVDGIDEAFIVMEFVDGKSLEIAIAAAKEGRPGGLSRTAFLSVVKQVAQALDYAHRKGIIHRDVKPANIVLTDHRSGETGELLAKIADFGVAKVSSQEATQQLGGTSRPVGTPNYMSPEQVAGETVTGASDQFSLAVIAYEVLAGQKAFVADSLEALLDKIRYEREEPVNHLNPDLSPTVAKVMQRALAKNSGERYNTCGEFAGALEFALGDSAPAPETMPLPEQVIAEESKGWAKKLLLLVVLCLAAGLALVLMVRMNSGPALPTQVLDTKNAPLSPPPPVDELKDEDRRATDHSPTVVKVPDLPGNSRKTGASSAPGQANSAPFAPKPEPKRSPRPALLNRKPVVMPVGGDVQLLTDPPGANVTVDGSQSCTTPCSFTLPRGRHTLAASLPGFAVARKIFNVPQDLSIILPLAKSVGVLLISSEPSGAAVNVDGQSSGTTPLTLRLSPGVHRIGVWDGTRWREESVLVSSDEVHTRLFRF
jgi:serine/threonine-protein kinase